MTPLNTIFMHMEESAQGRDFAPIFFRELNEIEKLFEIKPTLKPILRNQINCL